MRWENLFIAGIGTHLAEPTSALDAVNDGVLDPERFKTLGYTSICVDEATAPPDMAAAAARQAMERSGTTGRDLAVSVHGSLWFQGLDIWPASSYVAAAIDARTVPSYDVQQRCNIGLGAIELVAAQLTISKAGSALVTTADRFAPPAIDRWNAHDFNVYGDGGTAMVLSRTGGFARIVATATVADNALEGQARGGATFTCASPAAVEPIDLIARSHAYAEVNDPTQTSVRIGRVMLEARAAVVKAAKVPLNRITRIVTPSTGRLKGEHQVHDLLGVPEEVTTWDYGRTTGHIGAGDWAAGLEHLVTTRAVLPGDHVLLFGGGAGYTCTTAIVEILDLPEWT
jgi:3-oxoacyl-[acyl-carrier-protein] synthase-3